MLSTAPMPAQPVAESPAQVIAFPHGLVGCPDWRNFVLLTDDEENLPVAMLQCLDLPRVQLLVTDPHLIDASYSAPLSDEDRQALDLRPGDQTVTFCTLTVGEDGLITANLLGPLVVNARSRQGRQLVLNDSGYSTRHRVAHLEEA
jgi:flagellar assembly factor FliW